MNSSEPVGTVQALWRFPVKSMLGEQVGVVEVGKGGIVGDRAYAVRGRETGKVASAKHPKAWPGLFACRAAFVEPPRPGDELPAVRIDLADGDSVLSDAPDVDAVLSRFFGRATLSWRAPRGTATRSINITPTRRTTIPRDIGTRSSKRGSARHFSSSAGIAVSISIPNPARASTRPRSVAPQHHRPQKSEQRLARVLGLQQCVPIVDDPAEPVLDDRPE
jgi:MOSC N-terminal beta barrel domain